MLTIFVSLIVTLVEPKSGVDSNLLYSRAMIGTAALFYLLVVFNEAWLVNTVVFTACTVCILLKTGSIMGDEKIDVAWLALIAFFQVFTYASNGYRVEKLAKLSFVG